MPVPFFALPGELEFLSSDSGPLSRVSATADHLRIQCLSLFGQPGWSVAENPQNQLDELVLYLVASRLAKGIKSHRGVQLLAMHGLGFDALAVCRILLETTVAIRFILEKDSANRARSFVAHASSQKKKTATKWQENATLRRLLGPEVIPRLDAELRHIAETVSHDRYGEHWSGLGGLEQAMSTLSHGGAIYQAFYRPASAVVHAIDIDDHLFETEGETGVILEAGPKWTLHALAAANTFLFDATNQVLQSFGLPNVLIELRERVVSEAREGSLNRDENADDDR